MKKWALVTILMLVVGLGTASANAIVNFGVLPGAVLIPAPPDTSLTLSGVTFQYEPIGPADTAQADPGGIFGSTGGTLTMNFAGIVRGLTFHFSVNNVLPADVTGAVFATFFNGPNITDGVSVDGSFVPYPTPPNGDSVGDLAYTAPNSSQYFNQAVLFFSPVNLDSPYNLNVSNITFAPVPEPGSYALLGSGLLLMVLGGRRVTKRRS